MWEHRAGLQSETKIWYTGHLLSPGSYGFHPTHTLTGDSSGWLRSPRLSDELPCQVLHSSLLAVCGRNELRCVTCLQRRVAWTTVDVIDTATTPTTDLSAAVRPVYSSTNPTSKHVSVSDEHHTTHQMHW